MHSDKQARNGNKNSTITPCNINNHLKYTAQIQDLGKRIMSQKVSINGQCTTRQCTEYNSYRSTLTVSEFISLVELFLQCVINHIGKSILLSRGCIVRGSNIHAAIFGHRVAGDEWRQNEIEEDYESENCTHLFFYLLPSKCYGEERGEMVR